MTPKGKNKKAEWKVLTFPLAAEMIKKETNSRVLVEKTLSKSWPFQLVGAILMTEVGNVTGDAKVVSDYFSYYKGGKLKEIIQA